MNHNQNDGLLKMIRRTDPMILYAEKYRVFGKNRVGKIDTKGLFTEDILHWRLDNSDWHYVDEDGN